jgi:hypothetical protein
LLTEDEFMARGSDDEHLRRSSSTKTSIWRRLTVWLSNALDDAAFRLKKSVLARQVPNAVKVVASEKYKIGYVFGKDDLKDLLESIMSQVAIVELL